jgi:hypothetical protein
MDSAWWGVHADEVRRSFKGARFGIGTDTRKFGVTCMPRPFKPFGNSGAGAIALAAAHGARRVVLLGYDCQHTDGQRHWHGDHPPGTAGNAAPKTVAKWPAQFAELAKALGSIEVINSTRKTALAVFVCAPLESALCP